MLGEIDLLDRDRFTQGIPHEWFTWLRANAPVFHHDEPGGDGFWVITRYDDIVAANRDAASFSSAQERGGVVMLEGRPSPIPGTEMAGDMMLFMDPPRHTRYRKLVNRGFTPRMIAALEVHVRDLTVGIVEAAMAKGECDFVVDVAAELPLEVIAELLGVPPEDRHKLFDWSNRMVGSEDPEYQVSRRARSRGPDRDVHVRPGAGREAAGRPAARHRDHPARRPRSTATSSRRWTSTCSSCCCRWPGNETTRNAIAHGMNAFLEHPDQWDLLVPTRTPTSPARSRRSCAGRRRSCTSAATPPGTSSWAAS